MSEREQLNADEKELMKCLGRARYLSKRVAGIKTSRSDGSEATEENNIEGIGAEYFGAKYFKSPLNTSIGEKGDGGYDIKLELKIDFIHLGMNKDGTPRETGHLIVNPNEPQRWSDIYVLVKGSLETGYSMIGWITHKKLITLPKKDFGHGLKYAARIEDLLTLDIRGFFKNL